MSKLARFEDEDEDGLATAEQHVHVSAVDPEWRSFVGRLMTGYETAHRRLVDGFEILAKRAERAEEVASKALEGRIQSMELLEELQSRKHERELASVAAQNREAERAALMADARSLVPLIVKQLAGVPISGSDSHGLQDLLKSLTDEQQATLFTEGSIKLTLAQRTALVAVLQSLGDTESKKEESDVQAAE